MSCAKPKSRPRLALSLVAALLVSSCADAPSAPDASSFAAPFTIAPSLALVGPSGAPAATAEQANALAEAFDLVDRFRMLVTRIPDGETVVDTIIAVTPGQNQYDLSVTIELVGAEEQFSVSLTALQGTTELFTADPVTVTATTATPDASSPPPAPTNITMQYSGPGVAATSVQITPASLVLGPGGTGSFAAQVQGDDGAVIAGVPLSWTVGANGVVEVDGGTATATGEGAVQVIVATPTGLEARAWAYVVGGELAYSEGGMVKVRSAAVGDGTEGSTVGAGAEPAWGPGGRLFYSSGGTVRVAGGGALVSGSWPSVSPDGSKLAVDAGGSIMFANDDGTNPTAGPSGGTPVWVDGANLLVSGGSIQQVRADGKERTTIVPGGASFPALGPGGDIAYVAGGQLFVAGSDEAVLDGAAGRPSWSTDGMWLVVETGGGLTVVPADGSAPGASLPGLDGASDPAFRSGGGSATPPPVTITGLDPDPPIPGEEVTIRGAGFDWIIPSNNRVFWPTPEGSVEVEILSVTKDAIEVLTPRSVAEGEIRVETRSSTGLLTFQPQNAAIDVIAMTNFEVPLQGMVVIVRDADGAEVLRGETDDEGRALLVGLAPGIHEVEIVVPEGFRLDGEALRSVTLGTETVILELTVTQLVESVTTVPEALEVQVGSSLEVTLVAVAFSGEVMERIAFASWSGGTPDLTAAGEALQGSITGIAPGTGLMESVLEVELNGDAFEIPATVTSYVEGTVLRELDPAGAPETVERAVPTEALKVEVNTEPATGTEVKVFQSGDLIGTGVTIGTGLYYVGGLFAGTYDVVIDPTEDRSPVPESQTVVLDGDHPTATADFLMARSAVDHLDLVADPAEIDAIDGTTTIGVTAFDEDGIVLHGLIETFVSLDHAIATVNASGVVTGVTNGTVTIEVTVEGVTQSIDITVDQKAVSIEMTIPEEPTTPIPDGETPKALVGDTEDVPYIAKDANGFPIPPTHRTPNWGSGDTDIMAVSPLPDGRGSVSFPGHDFGPVDLTVEMDGATDVLTVNVYNIWDGDFDATVTPPATLAAGWYGVIDGSLLIESTTLTDLSGMETLFMVWGDLIISNNLSLMDLSGMANIEYVEGSVHMEYNPLIATYAAPSPVLSALMEVNGD
ncbi:MAG: hypothetical protein JRI25_17990, partial [Deltaproteobacteria bacterium]|nr:hypothetical protein [Deltaproteobacteria bacterium]